MMWDWNGWDEHTVRLIAYFFGMAMGYILGRSARRD